MSKSNPEAKLPDQPEKPAKPAKSAKGSRRPNPIDVHVGSRVRLQRMLLSMSQEKLGERLGLTFQQVQKYEKGINRIGASRLFDLSMVLGVPVQFFYEQAPTPEASGSLSGELSQSNGDGQAGGGAPGFGESASNSYSEGDIVNFLATREGLELNKAFARIEDPKVRKHIVDLVRSLAKDAAGE